MSNLTLELEKANLEMPNNSDALNFSKMCEVMKLTFDNKSNEESHE